MKDLNKKEYTDIVCSIHLKNNLFNVGDYLSAKGLSNLYNINNIIWLPDFINKNKGNFIYGGGGMIRPNFSNREVYKHYLNINGKYSIIGVGINNDISNEFKYSGNDLIGLYDWINNAEYVSVRDNFTYDFIKNIVYKNKEFRKIDVNPCPSYIYITSIKNKVISDNKGKKYKIGFVPSFGHTKGYLPYVDNIKGLLTELLNKYGEEEILIICHDKNDFEITKKEFGNIDSILVKEFEDVIDGYSLCESIITARAHGIIFSASLNLKCSYIYLSDKLRTLYTYHYGIDKKDKIPNFNLEFHIEELHKNIYPIKK